jgi:Kae1-associated kinase Bud32
MTYIAEGAEAKLERSGDTVRKTRSKKSYRVSSLDSSLRKSRTKREIKILEKLQDHIPVPRILSSDDTFSFTMEFVAGKPLKDVLTTKTYKNYCSQLGESIAIMHDLDIIHGDLTTSNVIVRNDECVLIDFGLSFVSQKIEDKAVDLHLLRRALESKHPEIWEKSFSVVLEAYKKSKNATAVLKRLEAVEERGRNKHKQ